jgi:hypothetical protein
MTLALTFADVTLVDSLCVQAISEQLREVDAAPS